MALTVNEILTYGLRGTERKITKGVPRTKFLQEHFFGGDGGIVTAERVLKLKIRKMARYASDFAQWDTKGNILGDGEGYKYVLVDAPYLYDRRIITPSDLKHLDFEEDPKNPMPYDEKLLLVLRNAREDLYVHQDTRVELMAMELLSTGGFTFEGNAQSYPISASMFVDADSDADGNLDNATNPAEWLTAKLQKVYDDSGILPNEVVMSPELIWTLLGNSAINDILLDTRRINGGQMDFDEYREDGVAFYGYIRLPGFGAVALLTYSGKYTDKSTGLETAIFPTNSMLIGHRNLGNINYAGVYDNANGSRLSIPVGRREFVHVVEGDGDIPSNMAVCRQTSPVLAPMTMGGWMFVSNVNS